MEKGFYTLKLFLQRKTKEYILDFKANSNPKIIKIYGRHEIYDLKYN